MSKPIVVVGSYNVGLFIKGERLPQKGETVIGDQFHEGPGGKGSNQAIAVAKLGGDVRFVACLGDDRYGDDARRMYEQLGMDAQMVFESVGVHSGISFVLIDRQGDNAIAVALGANLHLRPAHIDRARDLIGSAGVLACQLEGPLDTFAYALRMARSLGVITLLDPAPAISLPDDVYQNTDIITPNETEAEVLTDIRPESFQDAVRAGRVLRSRGVRTAIVKLGARGCVCVTAEAERHFPAVAVRALDVTGAGDAFAGGLMTSLAEGRGLDEAIAFATCVAALSVTTVGVVNALPTREAADALLAQARPHPQAIA
jgi:ribokinase